MILQPLSFTIFRRGRVLYLAALLLLAGCTTWLVPNPLQRPIQTQHTSTSLLVPGSRLGQTFSSSLDGLQAVSIYLQSNAVPQGALRLRVYAANAAPLAFSSPAAGSPLAEAAVDLAQQSGASELTFSFPPLESTAAHDLYLELELVASADAGLEISIGPADSYLDGALYSNDAAQEAQLTFRLAYDRSRAALGFARDVASGTVWIGLGMLLALLPGWALLDLLPGGLLPDSLAARLGLASGLGMAVYPLLLQWCWVFGWQPGALAAWGPALLAGVYLLVRRRRLAARLDKPGSLALGLLLLSVFTRAGAVHGLPVPTWGDSYQHSLITQLILDHGGLFQSWQPYTELPTFTYHFGFHSFAAVLSWVSGLAAPQAVLWAGQAAGILAVLALVPLAEKIGQTGWAAPAVILLIALLSPMPAFYANWGRYTQLAGQVILPVFLWLCAGLLAPATVPSQPNRDRQRLAALLAVAAAGLALTHLRVLILAALYPIVQLFISLGTPGRLRRLVWLAGAGLVGFIFYLPWFINSFGGRLVSIFVQQVSTPLSVVRQSLGEIDWSLDLGQFLPPWLWLMLAVSLGWSVWRRLRLSLPLLVWSALALLAANPQWLDLPGSAVIGAFTLYIAAYLPLGILAGALLGSGLAAVFDRPPNQDPTHLAAPVWLRAGILVCLLLAGLAGARLRLADIRPQVYALVTRPDERASLWLQANLPAQSRLLVNAFPAFYGSAVVGADGGWWLPLLAQRPTTLPPINYTFEAEPWPGYRQAVNGLVADIARLGIDHPQVLAELQQQGVTHLYLGQRQGGLNNPGPPLLQAAALQESPYFNPIYHQDRVWIFEVLP